MPNRHIIHVDMDAYYASVEELDNPSLHGKPVIVGGSAEARGVVSAASYAVRQYGVHSAMPMAQALKLCPQAIVLPVRMERYLELSRQIHQILEQYTPQIEPLSIDEAFMDVTASIPLLGPPETIARSIKDKIRSEVHLVASLGVAPNKFLAKLGSDLGKPDGLVIITEENKQQVLDPLPVSRIWGVGKVTYNILRSQGINTIFDLRTQPPSSVRKLLGNAADELLELAQGIDDRPVETESQAKSISSEYTFAQDTKDYEGLTAVLLEQVQEVAERLRRNGLRARTVTLKLRYGNFQTLTRAKTLPEASATTETLWNTAKIVFDEWYKKSAQPLRLIGFRTSDLVEENAGQGLLFKDPEEEKYKKVDKAVDAIRNRFGNDILKRGKQI